MGTSFSKIKSILHLLKQMDLKQLERISRKVDLAKVMEGFSKLDDQQLKGLMRVLDVPEKQKELPPINTDFYGLGARLTSEDRSLQLQVRTFMEQEVKPLVNEYWLRDAFPFDLIPRFGELGLAGVTYAGYGCPNRSGLMEGILAMEMARVDASMATFFGVQSGLVMGSIYYCGSEEQKQEWLPQLNAMKKIGAFGLTEPEVGSGTAGGLTTTCKREGDTWVLNGQKKWIGNATFADVVVIWAKDIDDGQVKGFLVRKETTGFEVAKIERKLALRIVQNGLITLRNCRVEETDRLVHAHSFKDTANILRMTRAGVAWMAVGCAMGAYESAVDYTRKRKQFGKPIASFQLIQGHLVDMLSNITAMQTLAFRLSEIQDEGHLTDEQASLAKLFCSTRAREVVAKAREVMGGNGILIDQDVMRFMADAEAIYSYEGTKEMNALIVGRAITGMGAFV